MTDHINLSDVEEELTGEDFLTLEEYLEAYTVASSKCSFLILWFLCEQDEADLHEMSMRLDYSRQRIHSDVRNLKRCGLIQHRRDPHDRFEEVYSYYTPTDMGQAVLSDIKTTIESFIASDSDYSTSK
jgi:DNA-binding MarR family transcriptional regulator